ncbi:hypothetical protein [Actinokineospora enzanensis]|uniref:hypothetical protein n=1 Tax=Actinokineospora enzanensis TaxID=155975 RepID=UPI00036AA927|nr:hypothetical protein [Actinokineospora enzanensis]
MVAWVLSVAAVIAALIIIGRAVKATLAFMRTLAHFADDWFGEPGRPGIPARPGVMAQLAAVRAEQAAIVERLAVVEHELLPNSGSSLRDVVDRVEQAVRPE